MCEKLGRTIKQVKKNKANGQMLIYINQDSGLKEGDWVELVAVPDPVVERTILVRTMNKKLFPEVDK